MIFKIFFVLIISIILIFVQYWGYITGQSEKPSSLFRLILFVTGVVGFFTTVRMLFPEIPWFIGLPSSIAVALSWTFAVPKTLMLTLTSKD